MTNLKGITIGEGSIVGARSVVTKDVEARTVVAGVSAKKINENVIEETQQSDLCDIWQVKETLKG